MTEKAVSRDKLLKYASMLGRNSTTYALLRRYDDAKVKPRIIMGNNGFRLEPRSRKLDKGHVVAIRGNFGADKQTTVTVIEVCPIHQRPAIRFRDADGREDWAYQTNIISIIRPVTERDDD